MPERRAVLGEGVSSSNPAIEMEVGAGAGSLGGAMDAAPQNGQVRRP